MCLCMFSKVVFRCYWLLMCPPRCFFTAINTKCNHIYYYILIYIHICILLYLNIHKAEQCWYTWCTKLYKYDNDMKIREGISRHSPDINFLAAHLVADDLRSHPGHSAGKRHLGALLIPLAGRAEVWDLHDVIAGHQDTRDRGDGETFIRLQ